MPLRFTTPSLTPSRSTTHDAVPGLAAQVVGGAHDARAAIEIVVDLAVVVGVVAERDRVDAGAEHLLGDLRRYPQAARGVLAVDDDERRVVTFAQHRQRGEQRVAARAGRRCRRRTGSSPARAPAAQTYFPAGVNEPGTGLRSAPPTAEERKLTDAPALRRRSPRACWSPGGCSSCCCRRRCSRCGCWHRRRARSSGCSSSLPHRDDPQSGRRLRRAPPAAPRHGRLPVLICSSWSSPERVCCW